MRQTHKKHYVEQIFSAIEQEDRIQFRDLFLKLHQRDQHYIFRLLYPNKRLKIANFLTTEEFARLFKWMDILDQEYIVENFPKTFLKNLFNAIQVDDIAQFIENSASVSLKEIKGLLSDQTYQAVTGLLSYPRESAGSLMTTAFVTCHPKDSVHKAIQMIRHLSSEAEIIYYIYVLDENNHLVGVLSLRDLIFNPKDQVIENVMYQQVITCQESDDQENVAKTLQNYDLIAIPVVNANKQLQGIITVDDLMDVIEDEVTEDFKEFSAISKEDNEVLGPIQTARSRTPWIIILIFLGLLVGSLISFFEETLESVVLLAAFIPMIMDTSGNVGTQSLAVSVRNLKVEESHTTLVADMKRELQTGFLLGLISGFSIFIIIVVIYQNLPIATTVSLSIFLSVTFSTVVGAVIPYVANRLNVDPAIASGPFITTINDAIGLMIYFSIANLLLNIL